MALPNTPIEIPTTLGIQTFIIEYYKDSLGLDSVPEKSIVVTIAWALASIYVTLFMFATWCFNQIFIGTADPYWVEVRGNELGIYKKEGVKAIMEVESTGMTATQIDQGTLYTINDLVYTVTANAFPTNGNITFYVQAPESGEQFELSIGDELNLVQPIVGVPNVATVSFVNTNGVDPEDADTYAARVDFRIKNAPQGGSAADYYLWSTDVDGITDIYAYLTDIDDNEIYPIADGSGVNKIPTAAQITLVEESIEKSSDSDFQNRRPTTAKVFVKTVLNENYDIVILGYGTGRPPSLATNIEAELTKYFDKKRASNPSLNKIGDITIVNVNAIITIINTLTNVEGFSITGIVLTVNGGEISIERPIPQYNVASLGLVNYAQ